MSADISPLAITETVTYIMRIEVELNRQDFLEFNKRFFLNKRFKRSYYIAAIFILIWIVIGNFNIPLDISNIFFEFVLFSAIWLILIYGFQKMQIEKVKRMPSKDGSILGKKTFIIEDNGLREITPTNETLVKWDGIEKLIEMEDYIYVFIDKIAAYVIPTRYFDTENEKELFIKKMKENINWKRVVTQVIYNAGKSGINNKQKH